MYVESVSYEGKWRSFIERFSQQTAILPPFGLVSQKELSPTTMIVPSVVVVTSQALLLLYVAAFASF